MLVGDVHNRIHLSRGTAHVNRDNGFSPFGNGFFYRFGSHAQRVINIHNNRYGIGCGNGGRGGKEGIGRDNDFIAHADPQRPICRDQGGGTGIGRHAIGCANQVFHRVFRSGDLAGAGIVIAE